MTRRVAGWVLAAAVVGAVFLLPWAFDPPGPVVAESWVLGFDNRVAVLGALAGLLGAVALAGGLTRRGDRAPQPPAWQPGEGVSPRALGLAAVATLLVGAAFHLLVDGVDFSESGYLLRRVRQGLAFGAAPWRDVELAYGPLSVWPTLLLARLGVPLRLAYDLVFLAANLMGLWLLAFLLRRAQPLAAPAAARVAPSPTGITGEAPPVQVAGTSRQALLHTAFALLALATFDLGTGLQYTLPRFLAPLAALVWLAGRLGPRPESAVAPARPGWRLVWAGLGASAIAMLAFALSPEIGLATVVATLGLGVAMATRERRWGVPPVIAAGQLLAIAAFPGVYFTTFAAFAGGGHALPVWPAPHVLLYLAAMFWAVPGLLVGSLGDPIRGPLRVAWAAYGLALVPAALGRADHTHALYAGLPAFIWVAGRWVVTDRPGGTWRPAVRLSVATFALVFVVAGQGLTIWFNRGMFLAEGWASYVAASGGGADAEATARRWADRLGLDAARVDAALARWRPGGLDPPALTAALAGADGCERVSLPLGLDERFERALAAAGRLAPVYFPDDLNLTTPAALERKRRDLAAAPCALVPTAQLARPRGTYAIDPAATRGFLRRRLLFPLAYRPVRAPFEPRFEIAAELRSWEPVAGSLVDPAGPDPAVAPRSSADTLALLRAPSGR